MQEIVKSKIWNGKLVTQLVPYVEFFKAEEYHQNYFKNNPYQPYCQVIVAPKVAKFRKQYLRQAKQASRSYDIALEFSVVSSFNLILGAFLFFPFLRGIVHNRWHFSEDADVRDLIGNIVDHG